ncbi:MAG: class I SAM-dependent methyltransferase [Rhizobacter sp.]
MAEPSDWVRRWSHLAPPGGSVLDVACGSGRHVRWFAARGHAVTALDQDADATAGLANLAEVVLADIEAGPWPLGDRRFDVVVVTNYLWRPLLPVIVDRVAEGGLLLYETFAMGNGGFGRPRNPDFLLREGELLAAAQGLRVVAYEHGFLPDPPRLVQRLVARRPRENGPDPLRHELLETPDSPAPSQGE